ncbi:MAG: four helix bundle protein [Planctomycetota bacterium]
MSRDHRKLRAFQLADEFVLHIYKITAQFPNDERFGLTSQMRRAAVSVAANLVEGCARETEKDYRHFCTISFGSLRETGYFIDLASRLGYTKQEDAETCLALYDETARVLSGLIRSLKPSS